MKYFFPFLMVLVIGAGVVLTATPFILEYVFPASKTSFQAADDQESKKALEQWFSAQAGEVKEAKAIRQLSASERLSWFMFKAERQAVVRFIRQNQLQQKELTAEILQRSFNEVEPPVAWWNPSSLGLETYFVGGTNNSQVYLLYNDKQQLGFLLNKAQQKSQSF